MLRGWWWAAAAAVAAVCAPWCGCARATPQAEGGGLTMVLQAPGAGKRGDLGRVAEVVRRRAVALAGQRAAVAARPPDRLEVRLPGFTDEKRARQTLLPAGRLEFRYVPELADRTWTTRWGNAAYETIIGPDGRPVPPARLAARVFHKAPILSGDDLLPNAKAEIWSGRPVIHFEFRDDAKRVFEEFTRAHIDKPLAIFLDRRLVAAPTIKAPIPGKGILQTRFTPDEARALAAQLNSGALPTALKVVGVRRHEP